MSLLNVLRHWSFAHKEPLARKGIGLECIEEPSAEVASAYVDLDSAETIGRATVWESGYCDLEIVSTATGEQLLYQHYEGINEDGLALLLDDFAKRIGN